MTKGFEPAPIERGTTAPLAPFVTMSVPVVRAIVHGGRAQGDRPGDTSRPTGMDIHPT